MTPERKETKHQPVLLQQVVEFLQLEDEERESAPLFVDGTLGGGGHSEAMLERHPELFLFGLDQDPAAVELSRRRLARFASRMVLHRGNFADFPEHFASAMAELRHLPLRAGDPVLFDRMLVDLGMSSDQLEDPRRGFSFLAEEAPLDMRLDPEGELTAEAVLNRFSGTELRQVFERGGVGRLSGALAREVVKHRPVTTTSQFAAICREVLGRRRKKRRRTVSQAPEHHPATVPFQALRIAVNDELGRLQVFLGKAIKHLAPRGRLAVISFHSLEDEIVAGAMRAWSREPAAVRHLPVSGPVSALGRMLTKKSVRAGEEEVKQNPRARSARLRVFEKAVQGDTTVH